MAKQSGLGMTVSVDNISGTPVDISNDVRSVQLGTSRGVQDITGVDKSAMERLLLLADGTIQFAGVFNNSVSHPVLSTVVSSDVTRTVLLDYGTPTLTMEVLFSKYDVTRSDSGELTFQAEGALCNGTVPTWA